MVFSIVPRANVLPEGLEELVWLSLRVTRFFVALPRDMRTKRGVRGGAPLTQPRLADEMWPRRHGGPTDRPYCALG